MFRLLSNFSRRRNKKRGATLGRKTNSDAPVEKTERNSVLETTLTPQESNRPSKAPQASSVLENPESNRPVVFRDFSTHKYACLNSLSRAFLFQPVAPALFCGAVRAGGARPW